MFISENKKIIHKIYYCKIKSVIIIFLLKDNFCFIKILDLYLKIF